MGGHSPREFDQVPPSRPPIHPDVSRSGCVLLLLPLAAGCADTRPFRIPPAGPPPAAYRIGCPDVLEVSFADRPEWDSVASVDVDGGLPLGPPGKPRVAGMTAAEARDLIARLTDVEPDRVAVTVADPRAARVYVCGPVNGTLRAVPYRGPEPVLDFLSRTGAIQPNCTRRNDVYVVRPNVAEGTPAEVFHVDVEAVLFDGDAATNVALRPSDQVYVGESRRSSFSRLLPEWLRPFYRQLVGLLPDPLR
jgi:polysaccharide export outer membrane protein